MIFQSSPLPDWRPLAAEGNAVYDIDEELDLSALEPLIALPSSPGNVVPVREVEGQEIYRPISDPRPIPAIAMPRWLRRWLRAGGSLRASRSTSTRLRASARAADSGGWPGKAYRSGRAIASDRVQRLPRHGSGARRGTAQPAHRDTQLPRTVRH
jgi:hypothetical protein